MSPIQKIIKYFALALAFLIIYSIIFGIYNSVIEINKSINNNQDETTPITKVIELSNNIKTIDINLTSTNLTIKKGTTFKIKSSTKNIKVEEKANKLIIKETSKNLFAKKSSNIEIELSDDYAFNTTNIDIGAGKLTIEHLLTHDLNLDLGAGYTKISNLQASNKAKISTGAGAIIINSSRLNNLDLDTGVGKTEITSYIKGKSKIDIGVGDTIINLLGSNNDYTLKIDTSIGTVKVNNKEIKNDTIYGEGPNYIDIDGGIGKLKVNLDS